MKDNLKSIINLGTMLLGIDSPKGLNLWKRQAQNKSLSDIQMDGFIHKLDDMMPMINQSMAEVKEFIKQHPGKILDYGCGTGRYIEHVKGDSGAKQIIGLDVMADIIENFTRKKHPELDLHALDLSTPSGKNFVIDHAGTFDGIYSISVIEYIPLKKLVVLLKAFNNLLKNGGALYIIFPHPKKYSEAFRYLGYIKYPPAMVERLLRKSGFEITKSYSLVHGKKVSWIDSSDSYNYQYVIQAIKT